MKNIERKLSSYPLFIKDPFFSFWMNNENPSGNDVTFWDGQTIPFYGFVLVDGKRFSFLGNDDNPLKLININISLLKTIYTFEHESFDLEVEYLSPLPLNNLEVLSCPVCFLNYRILPKKPIAEIKVGLTVSHKICLNNGHIKTCLGTRGDTYTNGVFETAWLGNVKQNILSESLDVGKSDWGYWYLAGEKCFYHTVFNNLFSPTEENDTGFWKSDKYITALNSHLNVSIKTNGSILLGYDDVASIYYFGEILRGYYFNKGKTIVDAIVDSWNNKQHIFEICDQFEKEVIEKCSYLGEDYLTLVCASFRQSVGAHKLVLDKNDNILFLSKENSSDGCIATSDITYPSMPLYLRFNPELVLGMLRPILKFANMPVWEYNFAPHDVGFYPYCLGQVYSLINRKDENCGRRDYIDDTLTGMFPLIYLYPKGNSLYTDKRQMPVEESANMIISTYLACYYLDDFNFAIEHLALLEKWNTYLVNEGLVAKYQLCTDDFMQKVDKNINLSLKSIIAIKAYAYMCKKLGYKDKFDSYLKIAEERASEVVNKFNGVLPIGFDDHGNGYSLKYNLVMDKLIGSSCLFPESLFESEIDCYLENMKEYGIPLDSQHVWTKSDWEIWVSCFTNDLEKRKKIYSSILYFIKNSPDRVPFSDWYDTENGKYSIFKARSVQGATFLPLLIDRK